MGFSCVALSSQSLWGEHLINAGIGDLVVLLPDEPGSRHFSRRPSLGCRSAAGGDYSLVSRCPSSCFHGGYFISPARLDVAAGCVLLTVRCCCAADRVAPHRADRDCLTGM